MDYPLHEITKNQRGLMHPISEISQSFINYATLVSSPIVDLGCAYGIATIEALKAGANRVIACDMEQSHLDILSDRVKCLNLDNRLTLKLGTFPQEIDFDPNTIGAVLAAYILPYLTIRDLDAGLNKIFSWLEPGGKIFILAYTVFINEFANKEFENEYQKRMQSNLKWPGYFEDVNQFSNLGNYNKTSAIVPSKLHFFTKEPLIANLTHIGFKIESAKYLDGKINGAIEETLYDGKELIGIVAQKPLI